MNSKLLIMLKFSYRWSIIVAGVILIITGILKWQSSLMPENTFIPPNPVPLTNAKDIFLQATSLMDPEIEKIPPKGTPANEIGTSVNDDYLKLTPAQKEKIIEANVPAFKKLEQGLNYPYEDNSKRSYTTLFSYFAKDRSMARALRTAAEFRSSKGDYSGAINYSLDSVAMGTKLPHGATLIGMLVGVACDAIGRRDIYNYIDYLNYQQTMTALERLESINNDEQQPYEVLVNEERFTQSSILEIMKQNRWRRGFSGMGITSDDHVDPVTEVKLLLESPRTAYDNYTDYLNESITIAKLPWPEQITHPMPKMPTDPVNQILLPVYSQALFKQYESIAENRMLEIRLALRAYKLSHNEYPKNLTDLTPGIINQLPTDPFSDNATYRYKNLGARYLLYSIGPDATDDGGKPVFDNSGSRSNRPYLLWDANEKGDIVSGVNDF